MPNSQPLCKTCLNPLTAPSDIKHNRSQCNKCRVKERVCTTCLTKFKGKQTTCQTCKNKVRPLQERTCFSCKENFTTNLLSNTCNKCHLRDPHQRFGYAKKQAMKRNIIWSLTFENYINLIKPDCYYCDGILGKVECSVGLDRLDNSKGYEIDNVVSCCRICNITRGEAWTPEETRHIIQAGIAFRRSKEQSV